MAKQALHPNHFSPVEQIEVLQEKVAQEQPLIEQEALHYMAKTPGWKLVEEMMDEVIRSIDDSVSDQLKSGASFEEIGKTSVIREITKDVIRRLRNRVNDACEAVESRGTTQERGEKS